MFADLHNALTGRYEGLDEHETEDFLDMLESDPDAVPDIYDEAVVENDNHIHIYLREDGSWKHFSGYAV